jgi:hypothetical protein
MQGKCFNSGSTKINITSCTPTESKQIEPYDTYQLGNIITETYVGKILETISKHIFLAQ